MPRSRRWLTVPGASRGIPKASGAVLTRSGKPAGKFDLSLHFHGIPGLVTEYRFHPTRRWRFDVAVPHLAIAIEQDGGIFAGGRHSRGAGILKDNEKLNEAARMGWLVGRFTPQQVKRGEAAQWLRSVVEYRMLRAL